jgi:hypothetical protein
LNKIPGICKNRKLFEEKPEMKEVYYIRAIVKNNCGYINDKTYFIWMNRYIKANGDMEFMKTQAVNASSWTSFSNILIDCVSEPEEVE